MLSERQEITSVGKDLEKRERCALVVGCKLVQPLWRMVFRFLKKLKIELPFDPSIPLSKGNKNRTSKRYLMGCDLSMFTAALFMIVKTWKPRFPSIDEWIKLM